ncbi:anhydro-N-acetylmuramic acid kinase [Magnetococcus sp. PR-3]|uniref:anhydro-N-acetylmuramic acid kinase n=1 Tax=Magnetococcus sp. PR-3 TaxID=3120355 RepID=UPI002FCE3990
MADSRPIPKPFTVIGLISGTSADAMDAVLVQSDGIGPCQAQAYVAHPFPEALRNAVLKLQKPGTEDIELLGEIDRQLGEQFAVAAHAVCDKAQVSIQQVDLIGSHGQTIRHRPPRFTLQIGAPSVIAQQTGVTTVADFRSADIARKGEGAPLAPLYHHALYGAHKGIQAVVNLGGIANITLLDGNHTGPIIAGDSGPANALMDHLMLHITSGQQGYDKDGACAARGHVDTDALAWLLTHPYLQAAYPKSTGKEDFGPAYLQQWLSHYPNMASDDGFATLAQLTVESVWQGCQHAHPEGTLPSRVILCGGGAYNPTLKQAFQDRFGHIKVIASDEAGVYADQMEAEAFAWLAVRTLRNLPGSAPQITKATEAAVLGGIYPGRNWEQLLQTLA